MSPFELLSELYRILSSVDEECIQTASGMAGTPEMRNLLSALALTAKGQHPGSASKVNLSPDQVHSVKYVGVTHAVSGNEDLSSNKSHLYELIDQMLGHLSLSEIARVVQQSRVPIKVTSGESRSRVLRRVVNYLLSVNESVRRAAIERLNQTLKSNQTSGWIKVIRANRSK